MKAYISVNETNRKKLSKELIALGMALSSANVEGMIFVDQYTAEENLEKEYLSKSMREIDSCTFVIVEASFTSIGVGVELGYAKAKKKPIIYLRHQEALHNTTLAALSDVQLLYANPKDLFDQLNEFLHKALMRK